MSEDYDVVVIGAGISGLTTAYHLKKRDPNLRVVVLEAKDRVGGRTQTVSLKSCNGTDQWDVGGQWVGRCQPHIMSLLLELGLETHPQYIKGKKVCQVAGPALSYYTGDLPSLSIFALLDLHRFLSKVDSLRKQVNPADPYACPRAEEWDSISFEQYVQEACCTQGAIDSILVANRTIYGAESSQISFLFWLMYTSAADGILKIVEAREFTAQEGTIKGGAQQVSQLMAKNIGEENVRLADPASAIEQDEKGVTVTTTQGHVLTATLAVLALPPPLYGRLGGRTLTEQLNAADDTKDFWDLGGEWVGRPQPHLHHLLHKFGMDTFNPVKAHSGSAVNQAPQLAMQARLDIAQFTWKLQRMRRKLALVDIQSSVEAVTWDGVTFESFCEDNLWTQDAKKLIESACRCMFGLTTGEMTLLYFLMYVQSAGGVEIFSKPEQFSGRECRVKGGMQQLVTHMAYVVGRKNIKLSQVVTHIVQTNERVKVVTSSRIQINCQRVVMAIPPHHAASINVSPPLPSTKLALLKSVPLAFLVKFAVTFQEAFWMEESSDKCYGFQSVLEDEVAGPVGIVYDATSARGNPALAGFISSPEGFEDEPKRRQMAIIDLLEKVVGPEAQNFVDFHQRDWSREPYNGGCFLKSLMPGTTKYFNSVLREPEDRIHFAGTETATVWCGFMNGAVQSGYRAATEVLYHLRPHIIASPDPEQSGNGEPVVLSCDQSFSPGKRMAYVALGVGIASFVYFLLASDRVPKAGIVNNIRLVLEHMKLDQ